MSIPEPSVLREITPLSHNDCFYIVERYKSEFTYPLHCHEEFELNYVEHASGAQRTVGDSIEVIGDYDLVLITGKELEHVWEQHQCQSKEIREITIQFSPDLFFSNFIGKNQFASIQEMLKLAQNGIAFPMTAILKVYAQLDSLASQQQSFHTVLSFLSILYELSLCKSPKVLSSSSFAKAEISSDSRRVQKIQHYINHHYTEEIRLSDMASLIGMSDASFSRFFKLRTGKNLTEYISDIRIGYATRLLADSTQTVAEICYDCGFNNLSHFNRIFLKKKGCTPKVFRENYRKKKIII